jgi:MFS family permease
MCILLDEFGFAYPAQRIVRAAVSKKSSRRRKGFSAVTIPPPPAGFNRRRAAGKGVLDWRRGSGPNPNFEIDIVSASPYGSRNFSVESRKRMALSTPSLRVFVPFAFGYFLSYLYRVVNAVIAPDLIADLGLDPSQLGLLTAAYFLTFAIFQLPLGVLLDRFGPRKIEAFLLLFACLGAFIFALAEGVAGLVLGRALIGFGVSACLMAAFKAFVLWFRREQLPLVNGLQMAAGGMGALSATAPVETALQITDWRGVFLFLASMTLLAAIAIFFWVPEKNSQARGERLGEQMGGILHVFSDVEFWRIAPLATMSQAAFLSIQGLWSGPWLRDVAGLERMEVARVLFLVAAAMVTGFILLGAVAERLSRIGIKTLHSAVCGMVAFLLVQGLILLELTDWYLPIWVLFGFFGTTGIISYAALSQSFPTHLAGRVNTGLNLLVFVAAFAGQWGIGAIIDLWPTMADGAYAAAGYRSAFAVVFVAQILGLAWYLMVSAKAMKSK